MSLIVEVVGSIAGFEALRTEWERANAASVDPNVFLSWGWLHAWWRHFGVDRSGAELHVVVVRDADGLVAAAPLFRRQVGRGALRAPVLHQISHDAGDYGGILLVRRHDEAVAALLGHLGEVVGREVSAAVFSRLTSDSRFARVLHEQLAGGAARFSADARTVDLGLYADVSEGYDLAKRQKKHRIQRRLRLFGEAHEIGFERHTGPTLEKGLAQFVTVHRRRWDAAPSAMQGLLVDARRQSFLLDAARALDAAGHLRLVTLAADGRTAAADLDFELAGRLHLFKTAFDPDFAAYAPGHLLLSHVVEDGLRRGVHEIDFMRGDHPYKRAWTNRTRGLATVRLTRPGWSGHVAAFRSRAALAYERRMRIAGTEAP